MKELGKKINLKMLKISLIKIVKILTMKDNGEVSTEKEKENTVIILEICILET